MKAIYHRGICVATYNRANTLPEVLDSIVKTRPEFCRLVLVDDGSTDDTAKVVAKFPQFMYLRGPNKGVIANKNRAIFSLQNCKYIMILEDDLIAKESGYFETYEKAVLQSGIHHFCRVQDKEVPEALDEFGAYMTKKNLTPIYGPTPRGDLTFITSKVISTVGGFNPEFLGVGYGHEEWSARVWRAGLIPHPSRWVDIKEARDCFIQKGDTSGGRWDVDSKVIKEQMRRNKQVLKNLKRKKYIYYPPTLY